MMPPNKKAKYLIEECSYFHRNGIYNKVHGLIAKEYALIVVSEIIKALRKDLPEIGLGKGYWKSVKEEIEKYPFG